MLFIQVFSKVWKDSNHQLLIWGLEEEYNRNFLGTAAQLWNMLRDEQKNRWSMISSNDLKVSLESLDGEMVEHISDVLGLTLVALHK